MLFRSNSPIVNYVQLANAYQIKAIGPVENLLELESALKKGAEYVLQQEKPFLIDVVME